MTLEQRELGRTGLKISALGLGAAPLGGVFGTIDEAEGIRCVHHAIDQGINFVDTSPYYGETRSETVLGEALAGGWRSKVILCSKAGRNTRTDFDFSPAAMTRSVEASLVRLRTDHLDLLIAHDIEFADDYEQVFTATAEAMHRLKEQGKCRFIGMSGLPVALLRQAVERCQLDFVLSYCHFTLQNRRLLTELLPAAESRGLGIINASPLAMGLLTMNDPPPWHPASDAIKAAARRAAEICRREGADLAAVGMRFCLSEPRIHSTLTGTARISELDANLRALATPIDPGLLAEIERELTPVMGATWPSGRWPGE